jgi:dipeptidyl aminopeptidase/acylaminoacyl peptidase
VAWALAILGVLIAYQLFVLVLTTVAWRNPRVPSRRTPESLGVPFSDVRFPTANRRTLHGWWIPCDETRRPALILVHGWGRNAERMLPYIDLLRPMGYHLLAFDARHHGASDRDGHASMKKFSEDIRAAVDFLAHHPPADSDHLGVLGLSIGGSAAIHAAAHDPRLRAVVTVGAFAHPREAMIEMGFGRILLAPAMPLTFRFMEWRVGARLDDLAPERQIAGVSGRVLLIHGEGDTVVPASHAHRLARAASGRAELWVLPSRGHSDIHLDRALPDRLRAFFGSALQPPP